MKPKLLLLLLFSMTFAFAGNIDKPILGPSIGLIMTGTFYGQGFVHFDFVIKNNGDETLTNVYVSNTLVNSSMLSINYYQPPATAIASLAPGEEVYYTFQADKITDFGCFDESQAMVHATKANGDEITDLSDPYDYYSDNMTYSNYVSSTGILATHTYQDNNNNSIVDVGDSIIYTYQPSGVDAFDIAISDNNSVLDVSFLNTFSGTVANGIHNLTQGDVDLGYVFNSVELSTSVNCGTYFYLSDTTPCIDCPAAPILGTLNFTTKLTDLLPNRISGHVNFDSNNDNCATGTGFPRRMVVAAYDANLFSTFTDNSGNYSMLIPNIGTYDTGAMSSLTNNFSSNPVSVSVASSGENSDYADTDFCIASATGYSNLSISLYPIDHPRPGFSSHYRLYFWNNGSTALTGNVQMSFDQTKASFAASTPIQTTVSGNTITWDYTNMLPFEMRYIDLTLNILSPPAANDGDILHLSVEGNPIAGDAFPPDNTVAFDQNIVNAFDPNDKTVIEGAFIQPSQVNDYLHYVTRFQNTGSASATTVVLKESLDADLDWSTFEPVGASHDYNIQIRNGSELTCTFSNIDLPNSSANETASHGWFAYRIKPKADFTFGDLARSKSDIYFDFNLPITTNEVNTALDVLSINNFSFDHFAVYPNPVQNYFVIKSKNTESSKYEISDANGRILKRGITVNDAEIDIQDFQSGYYFVTIRSGNSKNTYKIIKQ